MKSSIQKEKEKLIELEEIRDQKRQEVQFLFEENKKIQHKMNLVEGELSKLDNEIYEIEKT